MWYISSGEKRDYKTLVMQLAQVQAQKACLITRAFKTTSVQALNIEVCLTFIELELDKKADQTAARLCSGSLYLTLTQDRLLHPRCLLIPLELLEIRYFKLLRSSTLESEKRPKYIVVP